MTQRDPHDFVPLIVRRIANRVGRPFGINPFPRAFHYTLDGENRAAEFDTIYTQNSWGSAESRSGVGSEMEATARYRSGLAALLHERKIGSMFDAPCGDLRWMPSLLADVPIRYTGGDISAAVVAEVAKRHPDISVRQFDITRDAFPEAEVWHCRDCLFHLPFNDIRAALVNFANSNIPYALLTTHQARLMHTNLDLPGVGFRFLDLTRAPISLPKPLAQVADFKAGVEFPRYVGLWSRGMLRDALVRNGWL